jgi:hypothetical protein
VSATVLYMSMFLDGFIAGPNEGPGNGLGDGGERLHEWVPAEPDAERHVISHRLAGVNRQVVPVLFGQGRRLFDNLAPEQIELERTRILEGEAGVTHMHYRVR